MIRKLATSLITAIIVFFISSSSQVFAQSGTIPPVEVAFVAFGEEPIYGLILNSSIGEVRFRIDRESQERILYIEVFENGQFITVAGMNNSGVLLVTQELLDAENQPQTSPYFLALFQEEFIQTNLPLRTNANNAKTWFDEYDHKNELVNSHQLIADKTNSASIINFENNQILTSNPKNNFIILQPIQNGLSQLQNNFPKIKQEIIAQRNYLQTELVNLTEEISVEKGLTILNNASLTDGRDIVTVSIRPSKNEFYITLDGDNEKIWMINLDGKTVETVTGFDQYHKGNIPSLGITSTDLRIINFSNERLMDSIIVLSLFILLILIISSVIFFFRNPKVNF